MKTNVEKIKELLVKKYNPEKIILFGSYSNGKNTNDSDIDLLIVKNTDESFHKRSAEVRLILRNFNTPIDVLVITPKEFSKWRKMKKSFINNIFVTGQVIYEW